MSEKKLARRVASLQKKIDALQLFQNFVKNHPALYSYTSMGNYEGIPYLEFEERGYIKAVWSKAQQRPVLRLERYITQDMDANQRIVSEDISALSSDELAGLLKKEIKVDLTKPMFWDEDDASEMNA